MKISDLIAELQAAKARFGDLEVRSTWESITPEIHGIYRGRNGEQDPWQLLIDSDHNSYREEFEHPDDRPAATCRSA